MHRSNCLERRQFGAWPTSVAVFQVYIIDYLRHHWSTSFVTGDRGHWSELSSLGDARSQAEEGFVAL